MGPMEVRDVQIFACRNVALVACALALAASPGLARAEEGTTYESAGMGAASAFTSLLYAPVKLTMAVTGLVVGGLSYPLSGGDTDIMKKVITRSVGGDYVVTPANLRGEQPLEFFGSTSEETAYGQAPEESGYQAAPAEVSAGGYGS